jgi:hypothetical protein
MKKYILLILALTLILPFVSANVGVGVSPTKIVMQVESGKQTSIDLLVFNPGDNPLDIRLSGEGDIMKYISLDDKKVSLEPEPQPHALPIRNGQTLPVIFKAPSVHQATTYKGTLSATGTLTEGSQFGGSVGVATQVEITVLPSKSILSYLNNTYTYAVIGVFALVIAVVALKRAGLNVSFRKKDGQ